MKDKICFIGYLALVCFGCPPSDSVVLGPGSWAVLVAGAKGWYNYAIQADICHAYHVMLDKGLKKENIITMMFDDLAQNAANPRKGVIINRPGGPNVYEGISIDYRGKDVTQQNFLNVLLGKESEMKNIGTGKVLKSGSKETVFINFSGHGGTGLIEFPTGALYVDDLIEALHNMNKGKKFGKLIFYMDSCYSGSMFDNLIEHFDNVFASTAAAIDESSYNCYCNVDKLGICLGGLFDTTWMERLDKLNVSETIFDNYDGVRSTVTKSHVQMYGDYRLGFLEEFTSGRKYTRKSLEGFDRKDTAIQKIDVPLFMARMKTLKATGSNAEQKKEHLKKMLQARSFGDNLLNRIMRVFAREESSLKDDLESYRYPLSLNMFNCYKRIVNSFNENCFPIHKNTYFLKHLYKFANICAKELDEDEATNAIKRVCQEKSEKIKKVGTVI